MCMGGGGDAGAGEARAREASREANIRAGMDRIENIFGGGKYGSTVATGYDPNATYYNNVGEVWQPDLSKYTTTVNPNIPNSRQNRPIQTIVDPDGRRKAYDEAMANPASKLYSGYDTTGGFTDDFYKSRADAYTQYATPQLMDQYKDAHKQLIFSLARGGNMNSSEGARQFGLLDKTLQAQKRGIADESLNQANRLRTDVETQRTNLINQLNVTADPQAVSTSALNAAGALQQPMSFSPLAEAFSNITGMLSRNREQQTYNNANRPLNAGANLFSSNRSARVVA